MGASGDAGETLETVARRADVLSALDEEVLSKPALEDALRVSRSTIDRAVRELERAAFLERTDGGFTATTAGRLALEQYRTLTDRLETINASTRFLQHVSFEEAPPPAVFADADVRWPEPPEPAQVLEPIPTMLREADHLRALSRAVSDPKLLGTIEEQVVGGRLDVEFIYSEAMIDHLRSSYPERVDDIWRRENFQMYMTDTLPFSLGVMHGRETKPQLVVIVYNDDGELRGVLYNDTPAAIAWGEDVFRRERQQATRLE